MAKRNPVTVRKVEPKPRVTKVTKYGKSPYINYCDDADCKVWMPHGGLCRKHATV